MIGLPEPWIRLLEALATAPSAWRTPAELAEAVGAEIEVATDHLAALDESGWIEVWDRPEGLAVALSPLAASRMALKLVEIGPKQLPRWVPTGDPEPPAPRAKNVCGAAGAADLDFVVDHHERPESALERAELSEKRLARKDPDAPAPLPWPTIVLGQAVSPWREVSPGPSCPGCGGLRLSANAYCLCCGRWGLDASAASLFPSQPRTSARQPTDASKLVDCRRLELALRAERERRKQRRLSKLQSRSLAQAAASKKKRLKTAIFRVPIKAAASAPS